MISKLFLFLIVSAMTLKDPIMNLDLTLTIKHQLITTFSIGSSQVNVYIDINYQGLDICCKNANTIFKKIYYFLINPFRQNQDYHCKNSENNSRQNDTAVFTQIGPINIQFNEIIYPKCQIGILGFNKQSQFLSLMPINNQFFRIYSQSNDQKTIMRWKLDVGGTIQNNYNYFTNSDQKDWNIDIFNIKFDQFQLTGKQTIKFITNQSYLGIPSQYFSLVQTKLVDNYLCQIKNSIIYCPCTAGISPSFPKFQFFFNETLSYLINQGSYLLQNDEICTAIIRQIDSPIWEINIMLLNNIDILFDYKQKRVGIANHIDLVTVNGLINEPLQIILNCAVVLLMCFFVAMVFIQIIKQIINIEGKPYQSFESYMMKNEK